MIRRRWRRPVIVAVLVVAVLVLPLTVVWVRGGLDVAPAWRSGGECPALFDTQGAPAPSFRTGDLVPPGAADAMLCIYAPPDPSDVPAEPTQHSALVASRSLEAPIEDLLTYLNDLPAITPAHRVLERRGCNVMSGPSYQIVLEYAGGSLLVGFGCGVWQGDGLRESRGTNTMRAFFGLTGAPTLNG